MTGNKKGFGSNAKSFIFVHVTAGNRVVNGVLSTHHKTNHKLCRERFQVQENYCMVIQVLSAGRDLIAY
ncbi:MAG: hypothetical protein QM578_04220 [Pantoea sp.]|uniref:hypothetical protein n=1 Tax=unclassified Pantoea TaxID=2630326 RepID=UPI00056B988B|nr:hypothetical protein [Pantoea sp. AS-PWVM4]